MRRAPITIAVMRPPVHPDGRAAADGGGGTAAGGPGPLSLSARSPVDDAVPETMLSVIGSPLPGSFHGI
jgi:hypothetical protein